MKSYLPLGLVILLGLLGCTQESEEVEAPGLVLSETLPLKRIAALVPARSTESQEPDLVLGGYHYGVECRLEEAKRIDSNHLVAIFDEPEQHFEQYNPWMGGEKRLLVAVDNFGLPILSFESREGVPDLLKVRGVVPTDQGDGWHASTAFYCELNDDEIVQSLYSVYEEGGDFVASETAKPN